MALRGRLDFDRSLPLNFHERKFAPGLPHNRAVLTLGGGDGDVGELAELEAMAARGGGKIECLTLYNVDAGQWDKVRQLFRLVGAVAAEESTTLPPSATASSLTALQFFAAGSGSSGALSATTGFPLGALCRALPSLTAIELTVGGDGRNAAASLAVGGDDAEQEAVARQLRRLALPNIGRMHPEAALEAVQAAVRVAPNLVSLSVAGCVARGGGGSSSSGSGRGGRQRLLLGDVLAPLAGSLEELLLDGCRLGDDDSSDDDDDDDDDNDDDKLESGRGEAAALAALDLSRLTRLRRLSLRGIVSVPPDNDCEWLRRQQKLVLQRLAMSASGATAVELDLQDNHVSLKAVRRLLSFDKGGGGGGGGQQGQWRPLQAMEMSEEFLSCVRGDYSLDEYLASACTSAALHQHLQHLNLAFCRVLRLPAAIRQLTALTALNLQGNGSLDTASLDGVWPHLPRLTELDLRRCGLEHVPDGLWPAAAVAVGDDDAPPPMLRVLDLSENRFRTLPAGIGYQTALESLSFSFSATRRRVIVSATTTPATTDADIEALSVALWPLTRLRQLELRGWQLRRLPQAVSRLVSLSLLDVRNNLLPSLHALAPLLIPLRSAAMMFDADATVWTDDADDDDDTAAELQPSATRSWSDTLRCMERARRQPQSLLQATATWINDHRGVFSDVALQLLPIELRDMIRSEW